MIEESRTNLQKYSNDFSNAGWAKTRASIISNTFLAPDGTNTAFTLAEDTSSNTTHALQGAPITFSATSYTATAFLRSKERSWILLRLGASADNINAYFNIQTGTIGSKGVGTTFATIIPLGNGWYRCSVTGNSSAVYDYSISIFPSSANGGVIYTGDGASGVYVWGAQLETGPFPTSYIPTTTATVTRAADVLKTPTGTWFNNSVGTLLAFGNIPYVGSASNPQFASLTDNTSNNLIALLMANSSSDKQRDFINKSGIQQNYE